MPLEVAAMTDPQVAPHQFVGRLDRWCEVCNRPDRNPVHTAADHTPEPTRDGALGEAEVGTLRAYFDAPVDYEASDEAVFEGWCAAVERIVADRVAQVEADRDKYLAAFSEQFDQREEYAAECKRLWPIEAEQDRLRAEIEALRDEWDRADDLEIQTNYATRADALSALLAQPATGATPAPIPTPKEHIMSDEQKKAEGLIDKFKVERLVPSTRGIDHTDCRYFVLDPQHDPGAAFALRAYKVWAEKHGYGSLAADLDAWLAEVAPDQETGATP